MFSAKTKDLQEAARRAILAGREILYLIPEVDTRYDASVDSPLNLSHDGCGIRASRIHGSLEAVDPDEHVTDIFIDEAHFVHGVEAYARRQRAAGKRVYLAGLRTDYRGEPWPNTSNLIACHADRVVFKTGVCIVCAGDAIYTRLIDPARAAGGVDQTTLAGGIAPVPLLGSDSLYACVCAAHMHEPRVLDTSVVQRRARAVEKVLKVSQ